MAIESSKRNELVSYFLIPSLYEYSCNSKSTIENNSLKIKENYVGNKEFIFFIININFVWFVSLHE